MLPIYLNVPLSPTVSQTAQNLDRRYTGEGATLTSVGSECRRLCSNFLCHSDSYRLWGSNQWQTYWVS